MFLDDVSKDTAMLLANVVYFKGEWKYKFSDVALNYFYTSSKEKTSVPLMHQTADFEFSYYPEINSTILEMPYKVNIIFPRKL